MYQIDNEKIINRQIFIIKNPNKYPLRDSRTEKNHFRFNITLATIYYYIFSYFFVHFLRKIIKRSSVFQSIIQLLFFYTVSYDCCYFLCCPIARFQFLIIIIIFIVSIISIYMDGYISFTFPWKLVYLYEFTK